jgi:hypothetical protein
MRATTMHRTAQQQIETCAARYLLLFRPLEKTPYVNAQPEVHLDPSYAALRNGRERPD